ncbi:DUF1206 domain-containing protein [Microvirga soli]|uniref:DUF1206 domain-containing protein n=1 Tax=Microvirga soli TaxID=1854496 RepID=UPI0035E44237
MTRLNEDARLKTADHCGAGRVWRARHCVPPDRRSPILGAPAVGIRGALRMVLAQAFGTLLLEAVAGGLVCLALWRLIQAFLDPVNCSRDLKGFGIRAALGTSALAYRGHGAWPQWRLNRRR